MHIPIMDFAICKTNPSMECYNGMKVANPSLYLSTSIPYGCGTFRPFAKQIAFCGVYTSGLVTKATAHRTPMIFGKSGPAVPSPT